MSTKECLIILEGMKKDKPNIEREAIDIAMKSIYDLDKVKEWVAEKNHLIDDGR